MRTLYLVSVWLHVLAAITWIGGMLFLVLVVVPWIRKMRKGDRATGAALLRETGPRFADFTRPEWLESGFGQAVVTKLGLFAAVLVVSAVHDFSVGPRAALAVERDPASPDAERLRRQASLLGRGNALLALSLVGAAVVIVRGC